MTEKKPLSENIGDKLSIAAAVIVGAAVGVILATHRANENHTLYETQSRQIACAFADLTTAGKVYTSNYPVLDPKISQPHKNLTTALFDFGSTITSNPDYSEHFSGCLSTLTIEMQKLIQSYRR